MRGALHARPRALRPAVQPRRVDDGRAPATRDSRPASHDACGGGYELDASLGARISRIIFTVFGAVLPLGAVVR